VIDLTPFMGIGLLIVRPGTLIMTAPGFGGPYAPVQVKIGLTLLLGFVLMPTVAMPPIGSATGLAVVVTREMAIGLALGMSIRALVAAAELAGQLAGFQMGLSYAAIVDPQSGVRNNLLSALYAHIAIITFLLMNGHHAFLRALRDSYESLPMGVGHIGNSLPGAVMMLLGLVFSFGLRLAAPLVLVLVITEIALALVARSAPALNLMAVGAPIRIIIGLVLLGFVAPAAVGVLSGISGTVLQAGVRAAEAFR
jgi:flagellar biosynthesis protein FliR